MTTHSQQESRTIPTLRSIMAEDHAQDHAHAEKALQTGHGKRAGMRDLHETRAHIGSREIENTREHRRNPSRRAAAFAAILGCALFATLVAAVVAFQIVRKDYADLMQPFVSWLPENIAADLAIMAVAALAFSGGFYLLLSRFNRISSALSHVGPPRFLPLRFTRRDILKAGLVILVLWAPITVIMYPTGLTADTYNQLYQFQAAAPTYYPTTETVVNAEFIDHHPVFDTLLYGFFWQVGNLLGSQNAGVFALTVLQSIVLAFEMATLVCYLDRLRVPFALRVAALVFIAWFPFFGHYAATVLKDTTYLTVFIPWALMWVEAARTRGKALESTSFLAVFMVLGGLCIATKKMGVFVLIASLVVLAVSLRGRQPQQQQAERLERLPEQDERRLQTLGRNSSKTLTLPAWSRVLIGGTATLAVFCLLLPAVLYPAIGGVAPGGRQEALGPAIQQVTALVRQDEDALSSEDREACNKVFNLNAAVKHFSAFSSDEAKSTFHDEATTGDIMHFLQIWAIQGIKHPATYLFTTFETSGLLFIPFAKLTYYSGDNVYGRAKDYTRTSPDFSISVSQPAELVALNDYLRSESLESKLSDMPVVSLFFTQGFYGGWVPLVALVATLYARPRRLRGLRDHRFEPDDAREPVAAAKSDALPATALDAVSGPFSLTALAPFLFTVLFLLVSPVPSPRYILPLLFTAPLMLGWAWYALELRSCQTS